MIQKGFCCIRAAFGLISTHFDYLVLRANIRENPDGKNKVMTRRIWMILGVRHTPYWMSFPLILSVPDSNFEVGTLYNFLGGSGGEWSVCEKQIKKIRIMGL